jgi:hypothetical protein
MSKRRLTDDLAKAICPILAKQPFNSSQTLCRHFRIGQERSHHSLLYGWRGSSGWSNTKKTTPINGKKMKNTTAKIDCIEGWTFECHTDSLGYSISFAIVCTNISFMDPDKSDCYITCWSLKPGHDLRLKCVGVVLWCLLCFLRGNLILDLWCFLNGCRENHSTKPTLNQCPLFNAR